MNEYVNLARTFGKPEFNNTSAVNCLTQGEFSSFACWTKLTAFLTMLLVCAPAIVFGQDVQSNYGLTQLPDVPQHNDPALTVPPNSNPTSADNLEVPEVECGCDAKKTNTEIEKEKQKKLAELKKKVASAYKPLFYENDFSYLCDPAYSGFHFGENLKRRCLLGGGYYDIGGQFRLRGQFERNIRGLGLTGRDDNFLLYRTRVYGDFHFSPNIRFYAELLDAESTGEDFAPRPIEVNRTDMLNLFFDARLIDNQRGELTLRIGTQELLYGAQRAISPLDWANTRRTFQGIKGFWKGEKWNVDAFWTNPMRVDDSSFDSPDRDQEFMGVWSTYKGRKDQTVDLYGLRYLNGRGTNNFEYNTIGGRWSGSNGDNLWDMEAGYQFGENTDGSDHAAGMVTLGAGRKFSDRSWKPTLWLYYDYASGDNDLGAGNGYDQMFPLAHKYLGFMDLYGRRNIEDANAIFTVQPTERLKLLCWYHYLFLATQSDSPYSVAMTPFNGNNLPGSPDLGHEIDLIADWKIGARQNLLLGYSHFFSGAYYQTTAGVPFTGDADFFYTQWTINF